MKLPKFACCSSVADLAFKSILPRRLALEHIRGQKKMLTLMTVVLAASSEVLYGQIIWNPLQLVKLWDNRVAKFFVGLL